MTITCFIRHETDPFKCSLFNAERWGRNIPRRGGDRERFIAKEERRVTEVVGAAFQCSVSELQEA